MMVMVAVVVMVTTRWQRMIIKITPTCCQRSCPSKRCYEGHDHEMPLRLIKMVSEEMLLAKAAAGLDTPAPGGKSAGGPRTDTRLHACPVVWRTNSAAFACGNLSPHPFF